VAAGNTLYIDRTYSFVTVPGEIVEPLRSALPSTIDNSFAQSDPTTVAFGFTIDEPYSVYFGFFVSRTYGLLALIDPLWLWPILQDGVTFQNGIDTTCP